MLDYSNFRDHYYKLDDVDDDCIFEKNFRFKWKKNGEMTKAIWNNNLITKLRQQNFGDQNDTRDNIQVSLN